MKLYDEKDNEVAPTPEMAALIEAYRVAWKATYGSEPAGQHQLAGFDMVMEFS